MDLDLSNLLTTLKTESQKEQKKKATQELALPVEKIGYNEVRRTVLTHLEVQFWMTGEFPTEQSIIELFNTQPDRVEALSVLRNPDLTVQLANRGLPEFTDRSAKGFSPEAVIAANMIADIYDKRSISAKLKSVNLNTKQWNGFLKSPDFRKYFQGLVEERFGKDVSTLAKVGIARGVENGDLNAIKYYHEMSGEYRPQNEEVMQLHMIIARMMEVLAKFVSAEVLGQIANELDQAIEVKELTQ